MLFDNDIGWKYCSTCYILSFSNNEKDFSKHSMQYEVTLMQMFT